MTNSSGSSLGSAETLGLCVKVKAKLQSIKDRLEERMKDKEEGFVNTMKTWHSKGEKKNFDRNWFLILLALAGVAGGFSGKPWHSYVQNGFHRSDLYLPLGLSIGAAALLVLLAIGMAYYYRGFTTSFFKGIGQTARNVKKFGVSGILLEIYKGLTLCLLGVVKLFVCIGDGLDCLLRGIKYARDLLWSGVKAVGRLFKDLIHTFLKEVFRVVLEIPERLYKGFLKNPFNAIRNSAISDIKFKESKKNSKEHFGFSSTPISALWLGFVYAAAHVGFRMMEKYGVFQMIDTAVPGLKGHAWGFALSLTVLCAVALAAAGVWRVAELVVEIGKGTWSGLVFNKDIELLNAPERVIAPLTSEEVIVLT